MTDAACASCGTTNAGVRSRPWHEFDVALCARCHASLTGSRPDTGPGFTLTWALLVSGLLLVAAGAATYVLLR